MLIGQCEKMRGLKETCRLSEAFCQELFSFQQDVAATKRNPICWLRRAEAALSTWKPLDLLMLWGCVNIARPRQD